MTTIILQRFANREYRLTCQSVLGGKKKGGDKFAEVKAEKYARAVHDTYVLSKNINEGATAEISDGRVIVGQFGEATARQALRSLDIINEFRQITSTSAKGGWGALSRPTSFTRNARHRLLEAGAIVDADCGADAWEITCTLPGSTYEAFEALASHTGWLMDRLLREVRREKCLHWFYVWEWQKRGALHLHLLVAGLGARTRTIAHLIEYQWWELLWELSEKVGVDMFQKSKNKTWKYESSAWQSHTGAIQKSVAAYFAKYASKASTPKSQGFTKAPKLCPSRWWGCSSHIKKRITQTRAKYTLSTSNATSSKVLAYLHSMLDDADMVRRYDYSFDLGKTANGTQLGCGDVCIRYYNDAGFARMQTWEKTIWEGALNIARDAGEYEDPTQTWGHADMACSTPLDADMEERRHRNADMGTPRCTPPPSPHSQPSPNSRKLRNARGTQPEATLALRARLIQFLAGGDGDDYVRESGDKRATEYIQGSLFDTNYYRTIDSRWG